MLSADASRRPTHESTGVPFSAPASPTNVRRGESKRPSTSIHVASIVACYCVSQPPPQHQSSDILTNTNPTSVRCATASAGDSITHLSRGIHTTLPSMWETKQLCEVGKLQVGDTSAEAVEGIFFSIFGLTLWLFGPWEKICADTKRRGFRPAAFAGILLHRIRMQHTTRHFRISRQQG